MTVRSALLAGYAILLPVALFYRIRSGASGEKLDRKKEGPFILATLRPAAGLCFLGWIAWLWRPSSMAWSAVPLPSEARAIGFACWLLSAVLWIWTFVFLGKNLTDTVVTRKAHTLVTSGPYRFVRHPFYVAVTLHLIGAALISANAFILATGIATVALIALRTRREEAELRARFGEPYREFVERTGMFFPRGPGAWIAAGLVLLTLAAYARTPILGFISVDDPGYVVENAQVQAGLTAEGLRWAFTTTAQSNWHPLTWLSLMADTTIWGNAARGYHLTNLALHVLATLLLFAALDRATKERFPSAAVAALFALHPLHVESVAWVSERKDVLSAVFWMLTMLLYVRYAEKRTPARYGLVAGSLALGLLAKPMLVTLPLVLLLVDHWPLGQLDRSTARRRVLEKAALLILSGLSSWATILAQHDAIRTVDMFPLVERVKGATVTAAVYLLQMMWPQHLSAYYPHVPLPIWQPVVAAIALVAITVSAVVYGRRHGWLLTGWGWYLVTLVPVIGLVQVGSQARADRYTYIPLVGVFVIICWGAKELLPKRALVPLTAGVLGLLSLVTFVQVGYWRSSIDLFEHAAKVTDGNAVAHATLASALVKAGRGDEAREHLKQALLIDHEYAELHFMRTRVAIGQGRLREAAFMVGLEMDTRPKDVRTLVNAGLLAMKRDRYDEAIARFEEALAIDPHSVDAHLNLGSIRAAQGRLDEAIAHFEAVLRVDPEDPDAGRVLAELKAKKEAAR
ncbi:MAG TPA: tetratricopeptide repeat protein [Candidatus Polarisedimenticolaceae bacterium]|nr:tetratricopeptide repeat protein [Candidatus Polarisedimenticolaceae bacterium]